MLRGTDHQKLVENGYRLVKIVDASAVYDAANDMWWDIDTMADTQLGLMLWKLALSAGNDPTVHNYVVDAIDESGAPARSCFAVYSRRMV